jgi:hypothetical protein
LSTAGTGYEVKVAEALPADRAVSAEEEAASEAALATTVTTVVAVEEEDVASRVPALNP